MFWCTITYTFIYVSTGTGRQASQYRKVEYKKGSHTFDLLTQNNPQYEGLEQAAIYYYIHNVSSTDREFGEPLEGYPSIITEVKNKFTPIDTSELWNYKQKFITKTEISSSSTTSKKRKATKYDFTPDEKLLRGFTFTFDTTIDSKESSVVFDTSTWEILQDPSTAKPFFEGGLLYVKKVLKKQLFEEEQMKEDQELKEYEEQRQIQRRKKVSTDAITSVKSRIEEFGVSDCQILLL